MAMVKAINAQLPNQLVSQNVPPHRRVMSLISIHQIHNAKHNAFLVVTCLPNETLKALDVLHIWKACTLAFHKPHRYKLELSSFYHPSFVFLFLRRFFILKLFIWKC